MISEIAFPEAALFVERHHRHHKAPQGHKFSLGLFINKKLIGVAIVGRPTARLLGGKGILEVTRLCTDGTRNACSQLYSAAAREAKKRGAVKIITYILVSENGASLKASGWQKDKEVKGQSHNRPSRPRADKAPICAKKRYAKDLRRCHEQGS